LVLVLTPKLVPESKSEGRTGIDLVGVLLVTAGAASPGEQGTAVVVGHVDNQQGPAVFYGLGSLKKGQHIEVRRKDKKTAIFKIYGIEVFDKSDFPGKRVYGNSGTPELRVITCGGGFSKQSGYDSNVVVFARLTAVR
ncbi:sortase, partial [Streptomyces sp. NPDC005904]|uniref:sortase domain-containing protein n=1 Tax=Streptomyces sp. NPDC005904 TaxID=3154570 RepID=UPI00340B1FC1